MHFTLQKNTAANKERLSEKVRHKFLSKKRSSLLNEECEIYVVLNQNLFLFLVKWERKNCKVQIVSDKDQS